LAPRVTPGDDEKATSRALSAFSQPNVSPFAAAVATGLSGTPKHIASRYLYDNIGTSLFEAITKLPEFGFIRAEERILRRYATHLSDLLKPVSLIAKLNEGSNRATAHVVRSLSADSPDLQYRPLHAAITTPALLDGASGPSDWLNGAGWFSRNRADDRPIFLMLTGRSLGDLDRASSHSFLVSLRSLLRPGDYFLVTADLIKDVDKMLAAYDDLIGVVSAFNKSLLTRINRELSGHFNLRLFAHAVKWNSFLRRTEMHLQTCKDHEVYISSLGCRYKFESGETIHTESTYKLSELELEDLAMSTGFTMLKTWIDIEWPAAESLWTA
jgi:L-histidine N-alpha-methyltransferase